MPKLIAQFNKNWAIEFNAQLQGYSFVGAWIKDELHVFFDDIHILTMPYGSSYLELVNAIYTLINQYDGHTISKRAIIKIIYPNMDVNDVLKALPNAHTSKD